VKLTFDQPLDAASVADVSNFPVERWNYIWRADYGSKDWSVRDPKKEGRDPVAVRSATLSGDRKTLILKLEDLRPAMSMKIGYAVSIGGRPVRGAAYTTIAKE
jgi:hypothetical protein